MSGRYTCIQALIFQEKPMVGRPILHLLHSSLSKPSCSLFESESIISILTIFNEIG